MERGGAPSDFGRRDLLSNAEANFFKVGRETLGDTRVGGMSSRF